MCLFADFRLAAPYELSLMDIPLRAQSETQYPVAMDLSLATRLILWISRENTQYAWSKAKTGATERVSLCELRFTGSRVIYGYYSIWGV